MRKLAILSFCLLLLVTACGSFTTGVDDGRRVDDRNEENDVKEINVYPSYVSFADVSIRELDTYVLENPDEIADTSWFLAGGKTAGVEWTEAEYTEKMTAYQGKMGFVFQANGVVSFLQGDVTYQGDYYFNEQGELMVGYDATEGRMVYSCKFVDGADGERIMMVSGDDSMENVFYMHME